MPWLTRHPTPQCDEQTPACTRCVKRGEKCSFLTSPAEQDSPSSNSHGTPHDCSQEQHSRHLLELELMQQWTTITYKSMAYDRPDAQPLLTIDLPRSALNHEYLLDAIFSFTALHLASQCQDDPSTADYYVSAAVHFRDRGMARVAPVLQDVHLSEDEPEPRELFALFWFSALAGVVTMAMTVVTQHSPSCPAFPDVPIGKRFISMEIALAQLWRGTRAIMDIALSLRGGLNLGTAPPPVKPHGKIDEELVSFIAQLETLVEQSDSPRSPADGQLEAKPLYRQSVELMRKAIETFCVSGSLEELMAFGPVLGENFATLLQEGAPLALLNTLCYGTLLDLVSHKWWIGSAGKALVDECSTALRGCPEEWRDLISRARRKVGLPEALSPSVSVG